MAPEGTLSPAEYEVCGPASRRQGEPVLEQSRQGGPQSRETEGSYVFDDSVIKPPTQLSLKAVLPLYFRLHE